MAGVRREEKVREKPATPPRPLGGSATFPACCAVWEQCKAIHHGEHCTALPAGAHSARLPPVQLSFEQTPYGGTVCSRFNLAFNPDAQTAWRRGRSRCAFSVGRVLVSRWPLCGSELPEHLSLLKLSVLLFLPRSPLAPGSSVHSSQRALSKRTPDCATVRKTPPAPAIGPRQRQWLSPPCSLNFFSRHPACRPALQPPSTAGLPLGCERLSFHVATAGHREASAQVFTPWR